MVLHKNKWDHKAKIAYLKKHGLTRGKQQPQITPKWSSKKSSGPKKLVYQDDSDSEWDSEDEALLNHFYPEIAEQNILDEQKFNIKRQIISALREKQAETQGEEHDEENESVQSQNDEDDEIGGIYLGTQPEEHDIELPDLDARLSDFVISDLAATKSRKLLKNKILDTLLEDYGIASYKETVKSTDYNDVKKQIKDVNQLTADELQGFRIGHDTTNAPQSVRQLTEEEQKDHADRSRKLESAKLYEQMKKKFGDADARHKVLEINNFNNDDERLVQALNLKLLTTDDKDTLDDDLDLLLGASASARTDTLQPPTSVDLDELLNQATAGEKAEATPESTTKLQQLLPKKDEDFLDALLG